MCIDEDIEPFCANFECNLYKIKVPFSMRTIYIMGEEVIMGGKPHFTKKEVNRIEIYNQIGGCRRFYCKSCADLMLCGDKSITSDGIDGID